MADLIKNIYNEQLIQKLAFDIEGVYPSFQSNDFINDILDEQWESLELKERINHITRQLKKYLPTQYEEAISIIDKVVLNYGFVVCHSYKVAYLHITIFNRLYVCLSIYKYCYL